MADEHAVLLRVPLASGGAGWDQVSTLADRLHEGIPATGAGEFDGDEIGEGWATLYLYGPDADRLWSAVTDVVDFSALPEGSYAVKRYGEPGAREARVEL